jgi:magnesium-transporting ATPase (P-type)
VNDAPALKRADAGVAMGRKGSEAAKEASELVLADDNFASIAAAVREGRTVYDNIRKVISWTLPTNAGEALTIVIALLIGMTLPITPVQILWVNMITAVTLGIALAFEPTEPNTMARPPRPRGEPILTLDLVWRIVFVAFLFLCGVFGLFTYAREQGSSIEHARAMAVNGLVILEIFNLFAIRALHGSALRWGVLKGTRVLWTTIAIVVIGQAAITYVPFLQFAFGMAPLSLVDLALIFGVGVVFLLAVEAEKAVRLSLRGQGGGERRLSPA